MLTKIYDNILYHNSQSLYTSMKNQTNGTHIGLQNTAREIFCIQDFTLAHTNIWGPEACIYCVKMLKFDLEMMIVQ